MQIPSSPFLSLPPELHHLILLHLPYPDVLSLKHTSPYFYSLVDTRDYRQKVSWIVDRQMRGLVCPTKSCILKTDAAFCSSGGGEVRKIMERRRRHEECGRNGGCEVLVGRKCKVRRRTRGRSGNDLRLLQSVMSTTGFEGWIVAAVLLALAICIDSAVLIRFFNIIWESSGTSILVM